MRELVSKRSMCTKLYDLGNGKRKLSIRRGAPMHYRDAEGKFQNIDLNGREDQGDWLIDKVPYRLRISQRFPGYQYRSESGQIAVRLLQPDSGNEPVRQDGKFVWNITKDCRCEIQPIPHGVSTNVILDNDQAPKSFVWETQGADLLLQPPTGHDAKGRLLELQVEQDGDRQTITWTGRVADGRRLRKQGARGWNTDVAWPVRIDPTVNEAISVTADDRDNNGTVLYTGYTSLVVGQTAGGSDSTIGFRFQTVDVPQAVTIDSADFSIEVVNVTGVPDLRMYGNDVDDAGAWAAPGNLPNAITKTTAFTEVDNFTSTGVKTVDVTSIVQEIVNRAGWAANNDLALVLFDNQVTDLNYADLADLSHATAQEAQLDIVYTAAGGGVVTHTVGKGLTESVLLNPRSLVRH